MIGEVNSLEWISLDELVTNILRFLNRRETTVQTSLISISWTQLELVELE